MVLSSLLLVTLGATAPAEAQLPVPIHPPEGLVSIDVNMNKSFVAIPFLGSAIVGYTIEDKSTDGRRLGAPTNTLLHTTTFNLLYNRSEVRDWVFSTSVSLESTSAGDVKYGTVFAAPGPVARPPIVTVELEYRYNDLNGTEIVKREPITFRAIPNYQFQLETIGTPPTVGQFEKVEFKFRIRNFATSFDAYEFEVTAPPGFLVFAPPRLYVPGGETREVVITAITPKDSPPYELSRTEGLQVVARSVTNPGAQYSAFAIVKISGPYVPTPWIPIFTLGMLCIGLVIQRQVRRRELRVAEKGGPRPLRLSPRQQVAMKELKKANPEGYKAQMVRLAALYQARKEAYKSRRKEVKAEEAAARKASKAQLKEQKKLRAEQRKQQLALLKKKKRLEKARAKQEKKAAKAQAKIDKKEAKLRKKAEKKQAKIDAKERKRLEKVLKKKQAALKKAQAKAAKAAAKQAKKDAALAKKEAKAAKKRK
ncbi:MAG TPA: hypothetical protein VNZ52_10770 [Candidatus Thermoplasmatota archaeon]|nr:hypothetical protein [Candidatus Thermoplasmatota archaeon]